MTGSIVVAGDVHLGSDHADVEAFNAFLAAQYESRDGIAHLVLLGDVWDLVRRDPFGCAFETSETISRVKRLAGVLDVHLVLGNHDTYLRHLDGRRYDIAFHEELVLESGGYGIRFCHGEAFDRLQSNALSAHLSGPGDRGDIDPTRGWKDPVVAGGRALLRRGKRQYRQVRAAFGDGSAPVEAYSRRERRGHAYLDAVPEDKLVFGHTHRPYVRPDNTAANPGSWKATAPESNTYLVIEDGVIALHRFGAAGGDEVLEASAAGIPADD